MIHLLYGKDDYRVRRALAQIRDELADGDPIALASNTTVLDGRALVPQELMQHATSVPFLASSRLVIVEGLLAALGATKGGRRTTKKKSDDDDPLAPWRAVATQLGDSAGMPETTTLVFIEGDLAKTNIGFSIVAPIARAVEFGPMAPVDVVKWVKDGAKSRQMKMSDGAVRLLAQSVGGDLWAIESELDKLAAYAGGEMLDEAAVGELVSAAQDTKMWDLTDAVVAGNERKAIGSMQRLLADGVVPPILSSMIVRAYRQLAVVKDMRDARAGQDAISRATGVPGFKVDGVSALAARYSWADLRYAYAKMLDADLSVKRGLQDDESSLQLMVHELCALAPAASAGARRR